MRLTQGSRFASLGGAVARALGASDTTVVLASDPKPEDETGADPEPEPQDPDPAVDPEPAPEPEAEPDPAADPEPEPEPSADAKAHARVSAVFASEHSHGRERMAADMLATSMSADEITGLLAKSPKGGAAADPMLSRLTEEKNPQLGAGAAEEDGGRASAGDFWAKIRASRGK